MTQKTTNPWLMDVRVRERNLKSGSLTEKDLEKNLAALPDLSDQAENFGTSQPALVQQHVPVVDSGVDDEEDDEDEDEDDVEETEAAPAEAPSEGSNGEGEQQ